MGTIQIKYGKSFKDGEEKGVHGFVGLRKWSSYGPIDLRQFVTLKSMKTHDLITQQASQVAAMVSLSKASSSMRCLSPSKHSSQQDIKERSAGEMGRGMVSSNLLFASRITQDW